MRRRLFDLHQLSPAHLAALSICSSLLCPLSFGIFYLARRCGGVDYPLIVVGLLCCILGVVISLRANAQLTDDIRNERWKSTELEGLHAIMQHPVWSYLIAALIGGQFAPLVFIPHHASVGQCLLIPSLAIIRIRAALRPPTIRPTSTPLWGDDLRPIHSDHWGER
jgi:hypothetical protein